MRRRKQPTDECLVKRADTATWALPGGTLEWGETLSSAIGREIEEETGATFVKQGRLTGVYSRPDRDPRFHAVTVCVQAEVREPVTGPAIRLRLEAALFAPDELPDTLAMNERHAQRLTPRGRCSSASG